MQQQQRKQQQQQTASDPWKASTEQKKYYTDEFDKLPKGEFTEIIFWCHLIFFKICFFIVDFLVEIQSDLEEFLEILI